MQKYNLDLQAEGEAHIYVAIIKADGRVTEEERAFAPFYAVKSQELFNVMDINAEIKKMIKPAIQRIVASSEFDSWDEYKHLEKGIELLKASKSPTLELVDPKNEHGFLSVAKLNGYLYKESLFLKKIREELAKLSK